MISRNLLRVGKSSVFINSAAFLSTSQSRCANEKIAVVLSGNGVYDGTEVISQIHLTHPALLAIMNP